MPFKLDRVSFSAPEMIFAIITRWIPPEHFLCNVAATGLPLFAREHAKEFALQRDCFVISTKLIVPKQLFLKCIFVIIWAPMVKSIHINSKNICAWYC